MFRTWPLRLVLLAYLERIARPQAQHAWELQAQLWQMRTAFGGKEAPPELPSILKP